MNGSVTSDTKQVRGCDLLEERLLSRYCRSQNVASRTNVGIRRCRKSRLWLSCQIWVGQEPFHQSGLLSPYGKSLTISLCFC